MADGLSVPGPISRSDLFGGIQNHDFDHVKKLVGMGRIASFQGSQSAEIATSNAQARVIIANLSIGTGMECCIAQLAGGKRGGQTILWTVKF